MEKMKESGLRVYVDDRAETMQAKIRDAQVKNTIHVNSWR